MSQQEILQLFERINKPLTRKEVISQMNFSFTATNRGLAKLVKCKYLDKKTDFSGKNNTRKATYFLK